MMGVCDKVSKVDSRIELLYGLRTVKRRRELVEMKCEKKLWETIFLYCPSVMLAAYSSKLMQQEL